ncbi:hypothetical protein ZWY2020_025507 [Hordeum vulgare]|nr:hypothetical protein ZWY2020_025507 [Hordeum vulgare]
MRRKFLKLRNNTKSVVLMSRLLKKSSPRPKKKFLILKLSQSKKYQLMKFLILRKLPKKMFPPKLKVKKAIKKGNIDGARIYAENAIHKRIDHMNYLLHGGHSKPFRGGCHIPESQREFSKIVLMSFPLHPSN